MTWVPQLTSDQVQRLGQYQKHRRGHQCPGSKGKDTNISYLRGVFLGGGADVSIIVVVGGGGGVPVDLPPKFDHATVGRCGNNEKHSGK